MVILLIYDIPDDGTRLRIAERCKDYGLTRIQYSSFMGSLSRNRREELVLVLEQELGQQPGNIQIYPLCDRDLRLRIEIDRPWDRRYGA